MAAERMLQLQVLKTQKFVKVFFSTLTIHPSNSSHLDGYTYFLALSQAAIV